MILSSHVRTFYCALDHFKHAPRGVFLNILMIDSGCVSTRSLTEKYYPDLSLTHSGYRSRWIRAGVGGVWLWHVMPI